MNELLAVNIGGTLRYISVAQLLMLRETLPSGIQYEPMTAASFTSGVAPMLVVFSAVDSLKPLHTASVEQPATSGQIRDFEYLWEYGDTAVGTSGWSYGSGITSRNMDRGFIAGHVYETPGTYTPTLTLINANGEIKYYRQTITVSAFDGTTYYVASSGSDANAGTDKAAPLRTFSAGIDKAAFNTRILFKRGDTFIASGSKTIPNNISKVHIGAYDEGAKPTISGTSAGFNGTIVLGTSSSTSSGIKLMDLKFIGAGRGTDQSSVLADAANVRIMDFLALRLDISEHRTGIGWEIPSNSGQNPNDNLGIVDCHVFENEINGIFFGGCRIALMGNRVRNNDTSHLVRMFHGVMSVISHNLLDTPGTNRQCIKLHGRSQTDVGNGALQTTHVQISDNIVVRDDGWAITIAPQDTVSDERLKYVICERNICYSGGVFAYIRATGVTCRNNIGINHNDAIGGFYVSETGIEPPGTEIRIYNNTIYTSATNLGTISHVDASQPDTIVMNNILHAPNTSTRHHVTLTPGVNASGGSNNLIVSASEFVNINGNNFHLTENAWSRGSGIPLTAVKKDFDSVIRHASAPDLGAYQYV